MATLSHSPVKVARVALKAAQEALPERTSKYSRKDSASLPQLAACLVLQRFWDTSLRGVEQHLKDLADVRRALRLKAVPDHSAMCRARKALERARMGEWLESTVRLRRGAGDAAARGHA